MSYAALRSFSKKVCTCPRCRQTAPRDLVEETKKQFYGVAYLFVAFITCGFGLLLLPLFIRPKRFLRAYCENCRFTFDPGP